MENQGDERNDMSRYEFERLDASDRDGTIPSRMPWLILADGTEVAPVPRYAPQAWWERLLRRPRRQVGWLTGSFTTVGDTVTFIAGDHCDVTYETNVATVRVEWR